MTFKKLLRRIFPDKEMRNYRSKFKKRKQKLINYIKKEYTEYNGEAAFLDMNKMMLENYLEYYATGDNVWQSDESLLPTIDQLKECLALFNKLIEDKYTDAAHEFADAHVAHVKEGIYYTSKWDSDESYEAWQDMLYAAEEEKTADYKTAFEMIGKYCRGWWD